LGETLPKRWGFWEEITSVGRGWSSVIKDLRDDTPVRRDAVVLTGSNSRELRDATKNFAGRRGPATGRSDRLLMPIPFRDFCQLIGGLDSLPDISPIRPREMMGRQAREAIEELSFWSSHIVDAWELYLRCGGFPRAVGDFLQSGDVTPGFVQDLWDVVRGEAIRATSLSDADLLNLLARIPSERHRAYEPPDISKLSQQQLGLALALAEADGRADAFVAADEVMYERTTTSEIDFVGSAIDVPFESKYVERKWRGESRALTSRYGRGVVATRNVLDTDGDVWAVPASVVVWLLGS
jgi:hypothetical protein